MCRSDADSQLIVYIPFNTPVRLTGIIVNGPADEAPTVLKVFVNRSALGFDDVGDVEPAQTLLLKPADLGDDVQTKLKPTKFGNVNSLFVFAEREGSDTVALSKLSFVGQVLSGSSDMSKLKKSEEE